MREELLRRLVLKELADNALDEDPFAEVGAFKGGYFVQDQGTGIDGSPEDIARLYSIERPMVSTKLGRKPLRGALGNGLRVVAGAVLVSNGTLVVYTRDKRLVLRPQDDGTTAVKATEVDFPTGTRVEISFGPVLPEDEDDDPLAWAQLACELADGETYKGKPSPWWYDGGHFHEILRAADPRLYVRNLIAGLDGCSEPKAGKIAARFKNMRCNELNRADANRLLEAARQSARRVKPQRLGATEFGIDEDGRTNFFGVREYGEVEIGSSPTALIPFVVEVWARTIDSADRTGCRVCVNRTPVVADASLYRDSNNKGELRFFGCGLFESFPASKGSYEVILNITTPHIPITSDGKEPDLTAFGDKVVAALEKAVKRARRAIAPEDMVKLKRLVFDLLPAAIKEVSGDEEDRFGQRQLLYWLRPLVEPKAGDLTTPYFNDLITQWENKHGPIPGMYREPRGSIYHPHTGETIPLGTLNVEEYERPVWTFNKLLYNEKEGFNEALKARRWPERHDCAPCSSKGFTTRAIKDLIDKLAAHDEPITVFCVHDADAAGTMIYQSLQEATQARGARKIRIINLGLEPWEAVEMGLVVETVKRPKQRKPVADYVRARKDRAPDGSTWEEWLQTHRVELNAMTTPQFIAWLDRKMAEHNTTKLIPPAEVVEQELVEQVEAKARDIIRERILAEAGFDGQVAVAVGRIKRPASATLTRGIERMFKREQDQPWRAHVQQVAEKLTARV